MENFLEIIRSIAEGQLDHASDSVVAAIGIVGALLILASLVSLIISIYLSVSYIKYNRKTNSLNKTGEEVARQILDNNDLKNIKVSKNGSILFGNSYSHYFKKVRLRRLTWKKTSVTSLTMAAQKSCLAILDKEGDPDMKKRVRLTPFIYLGPLAFIPMVLVGVLLDLFVVHSDNAICTMVCIGIGLLFYVVAFIMSILVLSTEKKAQKRALILLKEENLATNEEIEMAKSLFKLYNIEYINNMVIALLELVYRVLQLIGYVQNNSSSD